jgi:type I restriction enzyme, S subunit
MNLELIAHHCPPDWRVSMVGSELTICNDLRLPLSEIQRATMKGEYPYFGPTGEIDQINEFRVEGEHSLIGEDGDHFLKYREHPMTLLVNGRFNVNNHVHLVKGTNSCCIKWFYYFFMYTPLTPFLTRQGVGRYKLTKAALEKLPILIPPITEQRVITRILSVWDIGIKTLEQVLLLKIKRKNGLMQQLLTGKTRFKEFIGNPWRHCQLGDIVRSVKRPVVWNEQERYHLASVRRWCGGLFTREELYGNEIKVKKLQTIHTGDYLISHIQAAYGAMALVPDEFDGAKVSELYTILKPRDPQTLDLRFIAYLGQTKQMWHMAILASNGFFAERLRLNFDPDKFLCLPASIPPTLEEQMKIVDVLETCDSEILLIEKQLESLKEQKRGLMQKLLTGEIRVKVPKGA